MKTIAELDEIVNELRLLIPNIKDLCLSWDETNKLYEEYVSYLKMSGVTIQTLGGKEGLGKEENYIFWKLNSIYYPKSSKTNLQYAKEEVLDAMRELLGET